MKTIFQWLSNLALKECKVGALQGISVSWEGGKSENFSNFSVNFSILVCLFVSAEIKDQDEQGFVCQGRVDQDYASLASSLIQSKSGDLSLFLHGLNAAAKPSEQNAVVKIQLFGRCFDRGSALIERTDYLFQNVR